MHEVHGVPLSYVHVLYLWTCLWSSLPGRTLVNSRVVCFPQIFCPFLIGWLHVACSLHLCTKRVPCCLQFSNYNNICLSCRYFLFWKCLFVNLSSDSCSQSKFLFQISIPVYEKTLQLSEVYIVGLWTYCVVSIGHCKSPYSISN